MQEAFRSHFLRWGGGDNNNINNNNNNIYPKIKIIKILEITVIIQNILT